MGPRNHVVDGGPDLCTRRVTFEEGGDMCRPIVTYLCTSTLCIVGLRRRRQTTAFATVSDD